MKMLLAAMLVAVGLAPAAAGPLATPHGEVILTVKGRISNTNAAAAAQFDRSMLEALPGRVAEMETPWMDGRPEFSGPYLRAILEAAGADGSRLIVRALNDYAAEIPAEDASELATILATRLDGTVMSVRDKGPLFLIYPFDTNPDLYNEKYFARSVWQISEIEVLE